MNIADFWDEVLSAAQLTHADVQTRRLSILLDLAQRELVTIVDPDRLQELGATYDFVALNDLESDSDTTEADQRLSRYRLKGINGMFWPGGTYDDQGRFAWPNDQTLKPELYKVRGLSISPHYYAYRNAVASGGTLQRAIEVDASMMRRLDDPHIGNVIDSDDWYERAQLTRDNLSGEYEDIEGQEYNVEKTVQPKFALDGNQAIVHPPVDSDATIQLTVDALFFPERFLDMDGNVKQEFVNEKAQCQMPSEFWGVMIEWAASRLKRRADEKAITMQEQMKLLQLGDMIHGGSDQARYADTEHR